MDSGVRDDLLKNFIPHLDVSKLLQPAPRRRRLLALGAFLLLAALLVPYARRYAWAATAACVGGDALALKSVRVFVRTLVVEQQLVPLAPLLAARLVGELPLESALISFGLPVALEALLSLGALLLAEQLAKSVLGLVVMFVPVRHNHHHRGHHHGASIVPAWRRQAAMFARAPLVLIDWLRLAMGAEFRWADMRLDGYLVVCVPRDDAVTHPFFRRALRRRYNDAHSGRFLPKSARLRTALAGLLVAAVVAGAPSNSDAFLALVSGGSPLAAPLSMGAEVVAGERVRALPALLSALDFMRDNWHPPAERVRVRDAMGGALARPYVSVRGAPLLLDVDRELMRRTGLWYGAELTTPFGSAAVVGVDSANQLWVAHDVHVLTRYPVPLFTYGAFESVSALAQLGVHVQEDPRLLGPRAAGTAAAVEAQQSADKNAQLLESALAVLSTMRGGNNDELIEQMTQMLQGNVQTVVINLDAATAQAAAQAIEEAEAALAEDEEQLEDEFIEEVAAPRRQQVQVEVE